MIMTSLLKFMGALGDVCDPKEGAGSFLGLPHWYEYLDGRRDAFDKCVPYIGRDNLGDVWLIALAGVDILLRIAALVAIGFIIYAGFIYMTSNGDPERTKNAKNTILNALIGLTISLISASVVSFIGSRFN